MIKETKVYSPNARSQYGFFESYVIMLGNLLGARELIIQLFRRDFFGAYKKSFFGIGWVIVSPLVAAASWIFMQSAGILMPGETGVPYILYVLIGSSVWGLFMGFYTAGESTLDAGAGFILQVNYPHEVLLVKQTAQHLANFLISFIMNLFILIGFGVWPKWQILAFPILIIPLFFFGAGVGLVMSVISVVSVEAKRIMGIILTLLVYATPVIYTREVGSPLLQKLIQYNPLTYLVTVPRDVIIYGRVDISSEFLLSSLLSFVVFLISWRLFFISEEKVIEKMI